MNVLVVGAGPAGLRVAERLAGEGISVTVFEQLKGIPRKVCSGLLSSRTVKRFGLKGLEENVVHGARIHAGNEEIFVERRRVAYVFDRGVLDSDLAERAESAGASILFGRRWTGERADVTVGADGFSSSVRRALGLKAPRYIMGAIGFVKGVFDSYVDVYLDSSIAPGFFAWVIPRSEGVAEVGLGVDSAHSSEVLARLRAFARRLGYDNLELRGARPIPVDRPMLRVVSGNAALVGDAAVQTKATTGGGISYGLRAADALSDAIASGDICLYQRFHRTYIYPRLLIHWVARSYLNRVDSERLLRLVEEYGIDEKLSERGDMDDPLFLLSPGFLGFIFRSAALLI